MISFSIFKNKINPGSYESPPLKSGVNISYVCIYISVSPTLLLKPETNTKMPVTIMTNKRDALLVLLFDPTLASKENKKTNINVT